MPGKIRSITSVDLKQPKADVEVTQGVIWFQRKASRGWRDVCTVNGKTGVDNLTYHYGVILDQKINRDFRFIVRKK